MRIRSLFFGLAVAAIFSSSALATTYYVSPYGSDSNPGTYFFWPWQTVAQVNKAALKAGDQVLFMRGGTWRETLVPQASGVTYGIWGSGARPVISGADLLSSGWTHYTGNIWSHTLAASPSQVWTNGILASQVSSLAAVLAPGQWVYGGGSLYLYSTSNPASAFTSPGVEASDRDDPLLLQNVSNVTFNELAFVDGLYTDINLGTGVAGYQDFNGVRAQGALYQGLSVNSGTPTITGSAFLYNGTGIGVQGGGGITLSNSLFSGNRNNALEIDAATGSSVVTNSTFSGNGTNTPYIRSVANYSTQVLKIGTSIILPNPFDPAQYPIYGVTDLGTNVYASPELAARAAPAYVVPFIDDYINLAVAQAVAADANKYGFHISYALNTKLVTPADWKTIAAMQAAGNEIVAHTRSHSDLANNNVFAIQYIGTAATATLSINTTAGTFQTFLNGSSTPDLNISISDTWNDVLELCTSVTANPNYTCVIQPNQSFFTPAILANVTNANIKTAAYMTTAASNYLTWEVEGAQSDIQANIPGYTVKSFATPYTSSNTTVENHIRDAGFSINRNGTVNSAFTLNGNWLFSNLDIYNIGSEWLPVQYDATKPAASIGALVEGLGAAGGVLAVYSHGYDEFTLAQWDQLFSTLKSIGGQTMTMSQVTAYIKAHGTLVPDGTNKNWVQTVPLAPNYSRTAQTPAAGAQDFQTLPPLSLPQNDFEFYAPLWGAGDLFRFCQ